MGRGGTLDGKKRGRARSRQSSNPQEGAQLLPSGDGTQVLLCMSGLQMRLGMGSLQMRLGVGSCA